jgi:hypothetical protein
MMRLLLLRPGEEALRRTGALIMAATLTGASCVSLILSQAVQQPHACPSLTPSRRSRLHTHTHLYPQTPCSRPANHDLPSFHPFLLAPYFTFLAAVDVTKLPPSGNDGIDHRSLAAGAWASIRLWWHV